MSARDQYPKISDDEIAKRAATGDMQGTALLAMARVTTDEARQAAVRADAIGIAAHIPREHDAGWSIALETPEGVIGLWSCWLRDRFYLGFPNGWPPVSEEQMRILGARRGVVSWHPYVGEDGEVTANVLSNARDGAPWHVPDERGGVPVGVDIHDSYCHNFRVIRDQQLVRTAYGWGMDTQRRDTGEGMGRRVMTYPFWRDAGDPEGWKDRLQALKGGFLALMAALAEQHGGCTAVNLEYGFVLVPEQLAPLGYDVTWIAGEAGKREGWGKDVVHGRRADGEEVVLASANEIVPWVNHRLVPWTGPLTGEDLAGLLTW